MNRRSMFLLSRFRAGPRDTLRTEMGDLIKAMLVGLLAYPLLWVAGDLYALEEGFFAAEGLAVEVKAGGPERDAIKELELGYAKFGVASADQVIRACAKGAKVVVLAQLFQINPLQWIYRPDAVKLESLADLKGQTIGVTFGGNDETIMKTLLALGQIKEWPAGFMEEATNERLAILEHMGKRAESSG